MRFSKGVKDEEKVLTVDPKFPERWNFHFSPPVMVKPSSCWFELVVARLTDQHWAL